MIKNKLQSRRGASLSMSLMVFLFCALASIVVLVVGTAAAGRMSNLNLADMDQRYYAVNSAAEMLRTVIDRNPTVKVVKTQVYDRVKGADPATMPSPEIAVMVENPANPGEYRYSEKLPSAGVDPKPYSLLTDAVWALPKTRETTMAVESNDDTTPPSGEEKKGKKLGELTVASAESTGLPEGIDEETLKKAIGVEIYEYIQDNGTLTFYISRPVEVTKADGSKVRNEYTLKMIFEADVNEKAETYIKYGTPKLVGGVSTTKDECTRTKTTTYTWHLTDVVKSRVPESWLATT